jgi:hypothetical protein
LGKKMIDATLYPGRLESVRSVDRGAGGGGLIEATPAQLNLGESNEVAVTG